MSWPIDVNVTVADLPHCHTRITCSIIHAQTEEKMQWGIYNYWLIQTGMKLESNIQVTMDDSQTIKYNIIIITLPYLNFM